MRSDVSFIWVDSLNSFTKHSPTLNFQTTTSACFNIDIFLTKHNWWYCKLIPKPIVAVILYITDQKKTYHFSYFFEPNQLEVCNSESYSVIEKLALILLGIF